MALLSEVAGTSTAYAREVVRAALKHVHRTDESRKVATVTSVEDRYAELEAVAEAKRRVKQQRQRPLLIAVINALVLATGFTVMVDLRRLQTPEGTALRWTQAAVFGDCKDYLGYSVADPAGTDRRTRDELCRDLRAATEEARQESSKIGLELGRVLKRSSAAEVEIVVTRDRRPMPVAMRLVRVDGKWRVVRNQITCASVGCA